MSEKYAVVIGAINVDIWGRSFGGLIERDSNPGEIKFSFGGVGRNIAHNMCLLGMKVEMLTAIADDLWAQQIEQHCRDVGIGLERAIRVRGGRTSSYVYITGPEGEMELAVCDADIARYITPEVIRDNMDILSGAELVVFDGNLTEETIAYLTENCRVPLFADPVSVTKARKLRPFLHRIHTIKPNALEAAELTGISDPAGAAEELVLMGVKRAFVSDGAAGIYAAHGLDSYHIPCCGGELVNVTGGGDAVMAALCRSFSDGRDILSSARYALAAGAVAVGCEETISPEMSDENIRKRMDKRPIY